MSDAIVEVRNVSKRFGGVQALTDVSLRIERGSIHALVGENGAGKSTLGRVISGAIRPDEGEVIVEDEAVRYTAPHQALQDGIIAIQQELTLLPRRTVLDNVFLGNESGRAGIVRESTQRERFAELLADSGFELEGRALVGGLAIADQKKVEILRALARNARVIVMDEPTAALSRDETETFLAIVRDLRDQGRTIIYVSHFLDEVLSLADTVTVLRNGRHIRTAGTAQESPQTLVEAMLGRPLTAAFPEKRPPPPDAPVVCSVAGLARQGVFDDVTFDVRAGEIVALAGLVGSGRTEIARAVFGADRTDAGTIAIDGGEVRIRSPRDAVRAGIALLPESRKDQGLVMKLPVRHNVTLANLHEVGRAGYLVRGRESAKTQDLLERLNVTPARQELRVAQLSGGNQQKVLFAKWLFGRPILLIADEPTRGVDVGAKTAIYELIAELAAEGLGVLLISSELEEVLGLAHRVLVMRRGRIVSEITSERLSEEAIMHAAFATASAEALIGGQPG